MSHAWGQRGLCLWHLIGPDPLAVPSDPQRLCLPQVLPCKVEKGLSRQQIKSAAKLVPGRKDSSHLLWRVCLHVRSLALVSLALVGSNGENTSRGNACCWACEKRAKCNDRSLHCIVAPFCVACQRSNESHLRQIPISQRNLRLDLPLEQLILRPTMLLLLAVKLEHVKEAMALSIEICAHSRSSNADATSMRFNLFSPYLVRSHAPVKGLATCTL